MSRVFLSEAEKLFILHGVQDDLRVDGRDLGDIRPITVETDLVPGASGSAHLRLANTDILVGVKAEIEEEDRGRIVFSVDCSANATPEFEGRGGDALATEISTLLSRAYSHVFDLGQLSVLEGSQCWALYVDILILECGGNLFDAVSMAVKAALFNTSVPRVTVTVVDGGEPELELSDDPHDGHRLELGSAPVLVTLTRIGSKVLVDPTLEEEACASACLVMGVTPGGVTAMRKVGPGSFHAETMSQASEVGVAVGKEVNRMLEIKLRQEESLGINRPKLGFLR